MKQESGRHTSEGMCANDWRGQWGRGSFFTVSHAFSSHLFSRHSKHPICKREQKPQNMQFFSQWHCCRIWVWCIRVTCWLYLHMHGDMQVLLPVGCCRFMGRPRHRSMRRQWRREIIRPYNKFLEPQMCVRGGVNVGQNVHKPWCICLIVNYEMMWQGFVGVQCFFIWYTLFLPNLRPFAFYKFVVTTHDMTFYTWQ